MTEPAGVDRPPMVERPGTRIGPYHLVHQLGEGGMGIVFRAEQSQPVERAVALKVIKPGMDTWRVIDRFEAEWHALALMDHPHVAKVLDAGSTPSGRPYFVMELVDGVSITQYCDLRETLDPRALGAVHSRLPGSAARAPEGGYPSGHQAVEHPGS